jgi:hypothetical protein
MSIGCDCVSWHCHTSSHCCATQRWAFVVKEDSLAVHVLQSELLINISGSELELLSELDRLRFSARGIATFSSAVGAPVWLDREGVQLSLNHGR